MTVPLMDPHSQYGAVREQIARAIGEVIDSGRFILGPRVRRGRGDARRATSARRTASASPTAPTRCVIALRALGVEPGDEVICPSFTFYATAESIAAIGAVPVFADIEDETYNLDPAAVEAAITPRTRAVMPVHLFGHPAPMGAARANSARKHGLALLEDAAQAYGAALDGVRCGALGDAATFSFFPTKNLPCFGDGGLITTSSAEVDRICRVLRFHGSEDKETFTHVGYNSRLDELQAAILLAAAAAGRRLERRPHRRRRALRGARPRRARRHCRPSRRARATSTTSTWCAARSASACVAGLTEAGVATRPLLRDAAAPAAGLRAPRPRRGLAAGDRALRARMPRAADVRRRSARPPQREVVDAVAALSPARS